MGAKFFLTSQVQFYLKYIEGRNISKCVSLNGTKGNSPLYVNKIKYNTRLIEKNKLTFGFWNTNVQLQSERLKQVISNSQKTHCIVALSCDFVSEVTPNSVLLSIVLLD